MKTTTLLVHKCISSKLAQKETITRWKISGSSRIQWIEIAHESVETFTPDYRYSRLFGSWGCSVFARTVSFGAAHPRPSVWSLRLWSRPDLGPNRGSQYRARRVFRNWRIRFRNCSE